MILSLQQGLVKKGFKVSLVKLCQWFEIPQRTVYYRSTKAAPKVQEHFVKPFKAMIEENPSLGYRTVVHLLGFNKNTVQRIFQLKGWQVRKRPVASGLASRHGPRWPRRQTSAGPRTCAVCRQGVMGGLRLPW